MSFGAYVLSYRECDWLRANLDCIYEKFDQIAVAVGPADMNPIKEKDTKTLNMLAEYCKTHPKVKFCTKDVWQDKNEMARAAFGLIKCDYLFQVDDDEFWPDQTLAEAKKLLLSGIGAVSVPHYIFYKDAKHIVTSERNGNFYFCPDRAFRVKEATAISHIPPNVVPSKGLQKANCSGHLWHFGWIGKQRMIDKIKYHRGTSTITPEYFISWTPEKKDWVWKHNDLGNLRIMDYPLKDIPEKIQKFVTTMAS